MPLRQGSAAVALLLVATSGFAAEPLSKEEARRRDAVHHFLKGRLLAADSEFEEAIREFRKAVESDPKDANLRREFAELLRDLSVLPEAEAEARKAVELAPSNPWANRALGQILLTRARDRKQVEDALPYLKKHNDALPLEPQGSVAYAQALLRVDRAADAVPVLDRVLDKGRGAAIPLLYGEALERSGQTAQAEELYRSLLRVDPENRGAAVGLLRVLEKARQFDKAVPLVESFLKAQPGNLGLKVEYGVVLMRARRFAEAGKTFREILDADPGNREALRHYGTLLSEMRETDKADDVLRRLQALEPDDPDVPFRRALSFLEARRVAEGEKILRELREKLVKDGRPSDALSQVDGQLAYAAYLKRDFAEARKLLQPHLFDEDGLNVQAYNLLAQVARDSEDWEGGLRLAREAAAKGAKTILSRGTLAEFLLRSGKPEDATEAERLLAALSAEGRDGCLATADAWQRLEKYDRAAAAARTCLEVYKEDPDILFRLAASLEREKRISEAVAAFERLLSARSDHAAGLNYLGYMWADRGENLSRALDLIRRAVELEPSNSAYLDSLGWVFYRMGRLDESESNLRAAAALNPDDATIEEHLGDLFERRGDLDEARNRWKRALTLKPEDEKRIADKLRRTESKAAEKRK